MKSKIHENQIRKTKIISKKIYTLVAGLLLTASVWAQAPQKMSYQAVIRNGSNTLIVSTPVGMKISVLQGTSTGTAVYVETHTTTTNANGLVSVEMGNGTVVSGAFNTINWANGPYFIKTETDPTGGTNYTIAGISQFLSVPYALFSANGTPGATGAQGPIGLTGPQGIQGIAGTNGVNGAEGANAYQIAVINGYGGTETQWLVSLQGATGPQGPAGDDGVNGINGVNGTDGTNGTNGVNGAQGLSAYQIAVINGYGGTETQWLLSLQGATGPAGTNGTNGGVSGFTHYLGEAFNGGIIFYLYKGSDGLEHGLIVALTESTGAWQTSATLVNANRTEDGAYNTNLMTGSPAATYIASLGAGWYLPSIDELGLLYYNRYRVQKGLRAGGNTLISSTTRYWSSTELSSNTAYIFFFNQGNSTNSSKLADYGVRAVRAF